MIYIDPPYNTGKEFKRHAKRTLPWRQYRKIVRCLKAMGKAI